MQRVGFNVRSNNLMISLELTGLGVPVNQRLYHIFTHAGGVWMQFVCIWVRMLPMSRI